MDFTDENEQEIVFKIRFHLSNPLNPRSIHKVFGSDIMEKILSKIHVNVYIETCHSLPILLE